MELTGKQRRHLRSLGHSLKPVVQLGKDGLDDGVVRAVDEALETHELIKLKISGELTTDRHDVAGLLAERTGSAVAQVLGYTVLLYRPRKKNPTIRLPKASPEDAPEAISSDKDDSDETPDDES